ncbi:MAG: alpha/beta hydrolase-fold protein [Candidatus Marinimicrobia bacterium]|jgi:S-formylglutathione hydrolase FrmB|nr:alpha/beta hydrolase-fold protein [Candidatus Neomarinimicrobiota bacterium]
MRKIIINILLCWLTVLKADAITSYFYSPSLGYDQYYEIVLPPSYEANPDSSYPSIYFLHGFGADYSWYEALVEIFEAMMASGDIRESVLIKPDGFVVPYLGSMYTNSEYNGQFEDYIIQDLIAHIDESYPTIDHPSYRAIMGHSMGGYGAVKLAVKFPEIFQVAASHAGPIAFENLIPDLLPVLLDETGILGYQPWNGIVSLFMYSASAAFSPDIEDWPYYVDLPVDDYGNVIEDVWELWLGHDPLTIAQANIESVRTQQFYLDCGDNDDYLFYNHSDSFSEYLEEEGINYFYEIYSGDHFTEVLNGDRFPHSLAFIEQVFQLAGIFDSLGDLDGNGNVTMLDFILLLQIVMQNTEPTDYQQTAGDLDLNGMNDIFDLLLLADQL